MGQASGERVEGKEREDRRKKRGSQVGSKRRYKREKGEEYGGQITEETGGEEKGQCEARRSSFPTESINIFHRET